MFRKPISHCLLLLSSVITLLDPLSVQATQSAEAETAARLFKQGDFAAAEKALAQVLAKDRQHYEAAFLKSKIALLANRLDEAQKWALAASQLRPQEREPKTILAECFYRRDDFSNAARYFREIGREAMAKKLESFRGQTPYQMARKTAIARMKFIQTDPLPLIAVRINASEELNFLLDTGGAELIVDPETAKQVGAQLFGAETATYAGGRKSAYEHGRLDSITLGDMVLHHIPIHVLSTRPFSAVARGKPVHGVIGTVLLYHFLTTVDYVNGELRLQPRTGAQRKEVEQTAKREGWVAVPIWMAGDHIIVARGTVGKSEPTLFFIDTGLAGRGFAAPPSTLEQAGITVNESQALSGVGGGGTVRAVPFTVDQLTLGEIKKQNISGLAGVFPPALEYGQGFRIGGLISHLFFRDFILTFDFTDMRLSIKTNK